MYESNSQWQSKDLRMYGHIVDRARALGVGEEQARDIAVRTVNEQRRFEGRTLHRRVARIENSQARLEALSRDELYERAKKLELSGRSKMRKAELIAAIRTSMPV